MHVIVFFFTAHYQGTLGKVSSSSVQHPRQMVDLMHITKTPEQVLLLPGLLTQCYLCWINCRIPGPFEAIPLITVATWLRGYAATGLVISCNLIRISYVFQFFLSFYRLKISSRYWPKIFQTTAAFPANCK